MTTVEPERDWAEGSGALSSYKDLGESFGEQDAGGIAAAGSAAGLDTLGLAMDPVGTILGGVAGWAIEHISFLREPLDAMLGDPPEIEARAKAWHLLSLELAAQATAFDGAMAREVAGWEGEAADAYRVAAGRMQDALSATSQDTAGISETVLTSAAMVGTVRSLIRDMIADWLGKLVAWLAATVISAGLAAAAAVPSMVLEATTLALQAAERISKVVAQLDEAAAALAKLVANMDSTADAVARAGAAI
ncbi:WXG100 family type VII secretion target, partial [Pseudonocardia sp. KRD291]|uniref:WXG100 family type VII secretion target n=1 Tax=Pseudonocardia sp. KRD291 TaxID=2792007 RepID=UPI001C49D077